jgi:hypothetical protein
MPLLVRLLRLVVIAVDNQRRGFFACVFALDFGIFVVIGLWCAERIAHVPILCGLQPF